jgi:DNA invertase Pin-like site-specific DNA recombinase
LMVCHHCDNRPCVNPAHLFLGTAADNNADMRAKGRARSGGGGLPGELNPRAKLTAAAVREIRTLAREGFGYRRLSRRFGVGHSVMKRVLNGQDWATV